jgi:hypothetical protein
MKYLFYLFLLTSIISCSQKEKEYQAALDSDGKFSNYISMDGKIFKDGEADFYPVIMNYSMDVYLKEHDSLKSSVDSSFFLIASPRAGYHPNYGNKPGETLYPWGNNPKELLSIIDAHFNSIKDMGFNALRITGFTSTDENDSVDGGFHTWSQIDLSTSDKGSKNITEGMIPILKEILHLAEKNKLRVILLLSAVETQPDNQLNFYSKVAELLKEEKALMAYDFYNEPLYFDKGNYTKKETKNFVESYNKTVKGVSPNHLTTIGLSHYKIVSEWDPELMDVDFLSFHLYPYGSKSLNKLERFNAKFYWISQTITKPWILGETGLNTAERCEPLNFSCGNYTDQLKFMSYSLNLNRSAGASGYSWWSFQDVKFPPGYIEGTCNVSDYGLVNRKTGTYLNSKGAEILGNLKHKNDSLPFKNFINNHPYEPSFWDKDLRPDSVYYNIDYMPSKHIAKGIVLSEKGMPVVNAIVTIYNTKSKSTYSTFTKPDGSFEIKTGWTNIFKNLDFKLKVSAVKMETVEVLLGDIYTNKGDVFDTVTLTPFRE